MTIFINFKKNQQQAMGTTTITHNVPTEIVMLPTSMETFENDDEDTDQLFITKCFVCVIVV